MGNAIGMIELSSIARGIETGDFMLKAAQVELNRASTVCPGKYMIIISVRFNRRYARSIASKKSS